MPRLIHLHTSVNHILTKTLHYHNKYIPVNFFHWLTCCITPRPAKCFVIYLARSQLLSLLSPPMISLRWFMFPHTKLKFTFLQAIQISLELLRLKITSYFKGANLDKYLIWKVKINVSIQMFTWSGLSKGYYKKK